MSCILDWDTDRSEQAVQTQIRLSDQILDLFAIPSALATLLQLKIKQFNFHKTSGINFRVPSLTLLLPERSKLHRVLAVLSAIGLRGKNLAVSLRRDSQHLTRYTNTMIKQL